MQISYFWNGLPPKIDAVYENSEGKFVFFKGNNSNRSLFFVCVCVGVTVVQLLVVNTPFTLTGPKWSVHGIRAPNSLMTAGPMNNVGF